MKFVWLKQGESIVKEEKVRAEFKRYILRGLKRSYELDELEDDLTEMDELFVDYNMEWTPEHSEHLKDITRKVLDSLKGESLKDLLNDNDIKNKDMSKLVREKFDVEDFPKEFTLGDVESEGERKKVEGILDDDVLSRDTSYNIDDLLERVGNLKYAKSTDESKDAISSKYNPSNKLLSVFISLPAETPKIEGGKVDYWKQKGWETKIVPATELQEGGKRQVPKKRESYTLEIPDPPSKIANELRELDQKSTKEKEKGSKKISLLLLDDKRYINDIIKNVFDNTHILDPYELYDIGLILEFSPIALGAIGSEDRSSDQKFKVKITTKHTNHLQSKASGTKYATETHNMARKNYLNQVAARLDELEEAVNNIP